MLSIFLVASLFIVSQAQHAIYHQGYHPRAVYVNPAVAPVRYTAPVDETPKPYSYSYDAPADGGASSRQETADENGRVTGSYSVADADGRSRVVEYFADETGFHANVRTNEPGTANQNPADVNVESTAPEVDLSYTAPVVKPVVQPVVNRIVAPAPLAYSTAPVNRGLYYSPLTHRHGLYDNHGLYNRGLYNPYGTYGGHGHGHGLHGGLYNNYGLYGNLGHYQGGYYPRSRYYY